MTDAKQYTTKEAAALVGCSPGSFREWADEVDAVPAEVKLTGKRGRPSYLWTFAQVQAISKAREERHRK